MNKLSASDIKQLKSQGCSATHWDGVRVAEDTDLRLIRNTRFLGDVYIDSLNQAHGECGMFNAVIKDCKIGRNSLISNVHGRLEGLVTGEGVVIENVGRIICESGSDFGVGTPVNVLDETGSRPVYIYPGLTSQMATLMAHYPQWTEDCMQPLISEMSEKEVVENIGSMAIIRDCNCLINIRVDKRVHIEGAEYLKNGSVINNSSSASMAYIGHGVNAVNFIVEDGKLDSGVLLRNCFVGQGCELQKGFTAHDSLFFANSTCECGEACSILAGPYTVTMHKSTLLIGGQYSFFNAGSGTNFSNHKYKLGPVHWGVMQRGVKTSSSAYVMWGGNIGAFSLVMGAHRNHPNTVRFPFSYLFSTPEGKTIVTPAMMLKSCGLLRDELKWPKRDKRIKGRVPLNDNIHFDVFNPFTISSILSAIRLIDEIKSRPRGNDGMIDWNGLKMKPSALERGREMYVLAVVKYLSKNAGTGVSDSGEGMESWHWRDLGGQIIPDHVIKSVMECESLETMQETLNDAHRNYKNLEKEWIDTILSDSMRDIISHYPQGKHDFDAMIEKDRKEYLDTLSAHNSEFTF